MAVVLRAGTSIPPARHNPGSMVNTTAAAYTAAVLLALLCSSWAADAARLLRQDTDIRILAIGDSITEGSVPSKNTNHPYTIQLEQQLRKMRPNARITIDNEGEEAARLAAAFIASMLGHSTLALR